ncbi:TetR/AcrR family transcriptional regulator [Amycolatopsis sp. NPDC004378]
MSDLDEDPAPSIGLTTRRPRKPGRPRGEDGDTRTAILRAAQATFAQRGFTEAKLREIASLAGVDVSLIAYYFGSKNGLFTASMTAPADLSAVARHVLDGPSDALPERLVSTYLKLWEQPQTRAPLQTMIRSASTHEDAARLLREFLLEELLDPIARMLGRPDGRTRVALASSHLMGVAFARHVLVLPPLAEQTIEQLIRQVTPAIRGYLGRPPRR